MKPSSIGTYFPHDGEAQEPVAAAVVIPTILRLDLIRAVESIYDQDLTDRLQIMIGIDVAKHSPDFLGPLLARRPKNVSAMVLALPYSTSARHGGVHYAQDGGATRSALSFMANSRHIAYLDDDNTWLPNHLSAMLAAIQGKAWAYSLRNLVDGKTGAHLGLDEWDSVGPVGGRLGGFTDPSCLMIDKLQTSAMLGRWAENWKMSPGNAADRHFFESIRALPHGAVGGPTVRYSLRPNNVLLRLMAEKAARQTPLAVG
jgi:hypothetical protein